jgi:hypothetical protein
VRLAALAGPGLGADVEVPLQAGEPALPVSPAAQPVGEVRRADAGGARYGRGGAALRCRLVAL